MVSEGLAERLEPWGTFGTAKTSRHTLRDGLKKASSG